VVKLDRRLEIFAIFLFSLIFRIIIFIPGKIPTGDVSEYATFVREISINGGSVPALNTLYFPGTLYIYPPALFLLTYVVGIGIGGIVPSGGLTSIYLLFIITAMFSSLDSSFIYWMVRKDHENFRNLISAIFVIFFSVDLYAFPWGGYPYIVAQFLMIILLYELSKRGDKGNAWIYLSSVLIVLIAFTHDLSYFLVMFMIIFIIAYDLAKRKYHTVMMEMFPFIAGIISGGLWWIPRSRFVYSAILTGQGNAVGPIEPINNIFPIILSILPFLIPLVVLTAIEIREWKINRKIFVMDAFSLAFFSTAILVVFLPFDETVSARISLYSMMLLMIILLKNLYRMDSKHIHNTGGADHRNNLRLTLPFILVIVMLVSFVPVQYQNANQAVTYYSTSTFQYDPGLVKWGSTNLGNGTAIAPEIGQYLSAIDGVRVIIYSGFFVGSLETTERNAAAGIILEPTSIYSFNNITKYDIRYIIVPNYLLNSVIGGHRISFPSKYYRDIGNFQYYKVYEFEGAI
jgi:hypothetical protein